SLHCSFRVIAHAVVFLRHALLSFAAQSGQMMCYYDRTFDVLPTENATNLDTNRVWKYRWRVQFTSEVRDNVDFIKISGRMIHDGSLFRLREHVLYKLQSDIRRFVIDISEVPHLDSSGCGEVISAHTSILRENGALAFVNPTERVRLLW